MRRTAMNKRTGTQGKRQDEEEHAQNSRCSASATSKREKHTQATSSGNDSDTQAARNSH